jgi:hypothetical protein
MGAAEATVADPGTAGAYGNEVDAVVLFDARNNSAAVAVAAQLSGVFGGQLQVSRCTPCTLETNPALCSGDPICVANMHADPSIESHSLLLRFAARC